MDFCQRVHELSVLQRGDVSSWHNAKFLKLLTKCSSVFRVRLSHGPRNVVRQDHLFHGKPLMVFFPRNLPAMNKRILSNDEDTVFPYGWVKTIFRFFLKRHSYLKATQLVILSWTSEPFLTILVNHKHVFSWGSLIRGFKDFSLDTFLVGTDLSGAI